MKPLTDRQKVTAWLDHIGETDSELRDEVFNACAHGTDLFTAAESRAYYVSRYNTDCALNDLP